MVDDLLNLLSTGKVQQLVEDPDYGDWRFEVAGLDLDGQHLVMQAALDLQTNQIICVTTY